MVSTGLQRTTTIVKYLLVAAAAFYIIVFFYIAFSRINYPFELEWTEGGAVMHIEQILHGGKLYLPPSVNFMPFPYTPLYFYTSALVGAVTGVGYLPLRLVSILCTLGCFGMIALMVKKSSGSWFAAFLSCGLFAASYRHAGAWYDIGRPDMLFMLLMLVVAYLARFRPSIGGHVMVGIFTCLAYLTKQHAPIFLAPVFLYLLIQNWRHGLIAIGTTGAAIALSVLLLDRYYDGWFAYYIFELPREYSAIYLVRDRIIQFWTVDFIPHLIIAFTIALFYFISRSTLKLSGWDKDALFYFLFGSGMILVSWVVRIPEGSYTNTLIPAYTAVAIIFGVSVSAILRQVQASPSLELSPYFLLLICLLGLGQFFELRYKIGKQIPTEADRRAGSALVERLAKVSGNVYVPWHSYLPQLAGKQLYANQSCTYLTFSCRRHPDIRQKLIDEMQGLLRRHYFQMIVIDDEPSFFPELKSELDRNYVMAGPVFDNKDVFWPVTGARWRPELIYVPREETRLGSVR
jgi:hypothetical protein